MYNRDCELEFNTSEIPETEVERQYYFIEKCRKYVEELEKELGRKLTFCVQTFGCPTV